MLNKATKALVFLAVCAVTAPLSHAYSECEFKVQRIFVSMDAPYTVWVQISDAQGVSKGAIFKNETTSSVDQLNRFHSQALSAHLSGRTIVVRYPETGLDCSADQGNRASFSGFWIMEAQSS